jgi:hypothetical protein
VNDIFNYGLQKAISPNFQPLTLVVGYTYELPASRLPGVETNRYARAVLGGWTLGGLLRYASGLPIQAPAANNNLGNDLIGSSTFADRVPGVPLFLDNLNATVSTPPQHSC